MSEAWKIFETLLNLQTHEKFAGALILDKKPDREACLRRVLRPLDGAGFVSRDSWMLDMRRDLDRALDDLTLLEIRRELGSATDVLPEAVKDSLCTLFQSEAFLRYVNAYLYFGIRFLAGSEACTQETSEDPGACPPQNVRPFRLLAPPPVFGEWHAEEFYKKFELLAQREEAGHVRGFLRAAHGEQKQGGVHLELEDPPQLELWLSGLLPDIDSKTGLAFEAISKHLKAWVLGRAEFYLKLNPKPLPEAATSETVKHATGKATHALGGWRVENPVAARLALYDLYAIARLLRADVSENATVTYLKYSWIDLLRFHELVTKDATEPDVARLEQAEEVLRSVFGYACDLVQNSVEITVEEDLRASEPQQVPPLPEETITWRAVFDEEMNEIERQRRIRHFRDPTLASEDEELSRRPPQSAREKGDNGPGESGAHWSQRIVTGEGPSNLIGLAFSGGGIRSATINLGVLQGLQELDLLRHVDYLSTVSGGGFIGSWLVSNVRRSAYWLTRLTDWSASIAHLRAYSNYLAPRTGILSADTWNLFNSWFRNTILLQLTGLAWLFVLLLATLEGWRTFLWLGPLRSGFVSWPAAIAFVCGVMLCIVVLYNLGWHADGKQRQSNRGNTRRKAKWVRRLAVVPAWIGAFAIASDFWANACNSQNWPSLAGLSLYSELFLNAWRAWGLLICASGAAFLVLAFFTLQRLKLNAVWISPFCTLVLYLEFVGIFQAFHALSHKTYGQELAFVMGPALVLLAFTLCVLLIIGFTGRNTDEELREWWTRFGTWLAIYAGAGCFFSAATVFGPALTIWLLATHHPAVQWPAILSWLGTVFGGLFAGKSSKTTGEAGSTSSPALEILAKVGSLVFILSSFILGATLLYLLMFESFSNGVQSTCTFAALEQWSASNILIALAIVLVAGGFFSRFFDINILSLSQFYRNRLVRSYLGASRWIPGMRDPNPFTRFDFDDDLDLAKFRTDAPGECYPYRGPFPLVNCTLNLAGSGDLTLNTRLSDSFTLTPLRCGSHRRAVGYAPTYSNKGSFAGGVQLGQAVAVSGAAVSSNMGYNTSPLVAFLLTMFNVRLGWWFPNPGQSSWNRSGLRFSLYYLITELLGIADEKRFYLNTSDGGHFENLGIYELVRRRARLIIACDAECDEDLAFGGLGNVIRICETDFGAVIDIDVKSIRPREDGFSLAHCAIGEIKYSSGDIGLLIYLKASMTGDEEVSIRQYRASHPSFPHESTADQFFSEDQFESYRKLGLHVVRSSFKGNVAGDDPLEIAKKMRDILTPSSGDNEAFIRHSASLRKIWDQFRESAELKFLHDLMTLNRPDHLVPAITEEELYVCLQLIQLMEDVFLDLRLDDTWEHPDNRGWAILFMRWARNPKFRQAWDKTHRNFGIRFEYFCSARLGLKRDHPIVRV